MAMFSKYKVGLVALVLGLASNANASIESFDNAKEILCGKSFRKSGGYQINPGVHIGHGTVKAYYLQSKDMSYKNRAEVSLRIGINGVIEGGFITDCRIKGAVNLKRVVSGWKGVVGLTGCREPWMNGNYPLAVRKTCDDFEWRIESTRPHRVTAKITTRQAKVD